MTREASKTRARDWQTRFALGAQATASVPVAMAFVVSRSQHREASRNTIVWVSAAETSRWCRMVPVSEAGHGRDVSAVAEDILVKVFVL